MRARMIVWCLLLAGSAYGFDWPVEKRILTATFAESRTDHLHAGIDLGGENQPVKPIAAGEVVLSHEEGVDFSSFPSGLGNFIVLQHSGGVRSIYAHLKAGTLLRQTRGIGPEETLGVLGDSGYSQGKHLHLSLLDSEMGTILNPLLVLPPIPDRHPPRIRRIYLSRDKASVEVRRTAAVTPGRAEVLVEAFDVREDVSFLWKLAPYRIFLNLNGQETVRLSFDSLREEDGGLRLGDGENTHQRIYAGEWLYRIGSVDLVPGDTELQILVRDFAGNEASQEILLKVQPLKVQP
jgi:hypothetical protein